MNSKTLSKRGKIRIIMYVSFAIIVLAVYGFIQTVKVNACESELNATRQSAVISLDEYLSNISVNLQKSLYASTPPMISKLASELYRETANAKNSLMLLPTNEQTVSNTYKFLSQVGEFVMSIERKVNGGGEITEEERERLYDLYNHSVTLNKQISDMCFRMQHGTYTFEKPQSILGLESSEEAYLGDGFDEAEQSLSDFPTLIYDGPFSSHIENSEPEFLKDKDMTLKERALAIAKKVSGEEVSFLYEESGTIPCYVFQGENVTVAITKKGGIPLYMLNSQYAGEIKTSYEKAIENAKDFLKKIGYSDLKESYYFTDDGICTVNFTAVQDNIILYADLIKVGINLETGNIISFDATGYVSNHKERITEPKIISEEDACKALNQNLEVLGIQKCIIPTEWKGENYCYEIHCKTKDSQEILVYINCKSGIENDILILLYSDGGVLTK